MFRIMYLLQKTWDYKRVRVWYDVITENISISSDYLDKEKIKIYRNSVKGKKKRQEWWDSEVGRISKKIRDRKWNQTSKGKVCKKKFLARRRRNLQWIQMFENPFDKSELIDYHHVTNVYVVAIPRDLHRMYGGKFHREKVMEIVKQIYLGG